MKITRIVFTGRFVLKSKRNIFNVAVCILSGIIVAAFVLFSTDMEVLKRNISALDLRWIAVALTLVAAQWFFEGATLHVLTRPFFPIRLRDSLELSMTGLYFNAITPFATGGQPFQAYTMKRMGMDLGDAMGVLLSKFLVYQTSVVGVSTVFIVSKWDFFRNEITAMIEGKTFLNFTVLLLIGYVINTLVFLIALMFAVFPETSKKMADFFIWVLAKLRFVKNPAKTKEYFHGKLDQCGKGFRALIHNLPVLIRSFLYTVLYLLSYVAVPYAVYRAFDSALGPQAAAFGLFTVMGAEAFVMLVSSFFPLPGSSVGAEFFFYSFFLLFFNGSDGLTKVSVIVWRVITFYLTIAVGVIFVVHTNRNYKKDPATDRSSKP